MKFLVRCINVAKNGYLYDRFEKDIRRKMINLRYDLKELEEAYKEKEEEKRNQLLKNIQELQNKKDSLQKEFELDIEKYQKELDEKHKSMDIHFGNLTNNLIIDLQDLQLEKSKLQGEIEELKKEKRNIKSVDEKVSTKRGAITRLKKFMKEFK